MPTITLYYDSDIYRRLSVDDLRELNASLINALARRLQIPQQNVAVRPIVFEAETAQNTLDIEANVSFNVGPRCLIKTFTPAQADVLGELILMIMEESAPLQRVEAYDLGVEVQPHHGGMFHSNT